MKSREYTDPEMKEQVQLFVTGELNEDEQNEVIDRISSTPRNRRYYDGLRAALISAEYYYSSDKKYDIERVRSRLNNRIELTGKERKTDFRILFRVAYMPLPTNSKTKSNACSGKTMVLFCITRHSRKKSLNGRKAKMRP